MDERRGGASQAQALAANVRVVRPARSPAALPSRGVRASWARSSCASSGRRRRIRRRPRRKSVSTRARRSESIANYLQDLTRVTAALREALAADGLLGEVKDEVARVDEASAREASMGALSVLEAQLKEPVEEEKVPAASRAKADGIRIGIDTLVGIHVPADVVPALKSLLDEYALALSGK